MTALQGGLVAAPTEFSDPAADETLYSKRSQYALSGVHSTPSADAAALVSIESTDEPTLGRENNRGVRTVEPAITAVTC